MAESLACRAALWAASQAGFSNVYLELDCLQLVQAINSKSVLVEAHGVLSDVFICIASFVHFSCRFIPRSANGGADSLAKHALSVFGSIA